MNVSLSTDDIFIVAGICCNVYTFNQLSDFNDIDKLFEVNKFTPDNIAIERKNYLNLPFSNKCILILYMTKPNYGHWCCMVRRKENANKMRYDFLDSYGEVIDIQKEAIPEKFRKESKQNIPYLIQMLADKKNIDVHYNSRQMQKYGDVATCGRYCGLYMRYNKIPIETFVNTIIEFAKKINSDPDNAVVMLSEPYLKNMIVD